jgi:GAF domain-containing protein
VSEDRRLDILTRLSVRSGEVPHGIRLCEVAVDVTDVTGAGVTLIGDDGSPTAVCTTDAVSALVEELQYTLGEGPCIDAYRQDRPVLEPNLADPGTVRWIAFTGLALEAGVRGIFGFPIRSGGAAFGALDLYCDQPGPLSDGQHAYALAVADLAAPVLLAKQANAPPGELAADLATGATSRWVVHRAAGMVAVQLGVSVGEAVVRLRGYAFANNRILSDVAEAVVARELRFNVG